MAPNALQVAIALAPVLSRNPVPPSKSYVYEHIYVCSYTGVRATGWCASIPILLKELGFKFSAFAENHTYPSLDFSK